MLILLSTECKRCRVECWLCTPCAWFRLPLTPAGLDSNWASHSHYQWCPSKAHVDLYPTYTVKKKKSNNWQVSILYYWCMYLTYFYCHLKFNLKLSRHSFSRRVTYLKFKNLPLEFFDVCALDHVSLILPLCDPAHLPDQFKQHLHRLIGYLQVLMVLK